MPETGSAELPVERWSRGRTTQTPDRVAEEKPVALVYQGMPHVVMLATPADLEDFAVGFTLSEALVAHAARDPVGRSGARRPRPSKCASASPAERFPHCSSGDAISPAAPAAGCAARKPSSRPSARRRRGQGPDSHGRRAARGARRDSGAAADQCADRQRARGRLGRARAGINCVREDVGRHNALDKTIGALMRAGADFTAGYMLITSRASYEMVQKSATVGICLAGRRVGADGARHPGGREERRDAGGFRTRATSTSSMRTRSG